MTKEKNEQSCDIRFSVQKANLNKANRVLLLPLWPLDSLFPSSNLSECVFVQSRRICRTTFSSPLALSLSRFCFGARSCECRARRETRPRMCSHASERQLRRESVDVIECCLDSSSRVSRHAHECSAPKLKLSAFTRFNQRNNV